MPRRPLVGQGLFTLEGTRSHSDTVHSLRLLWTSDQPDAQTSSWQHTTLTRDKCPCIQRDSNTQSQQDKSHDLDRAAAGIGSVRLKKSNIGILTSDKPWACPYRPPNYWPLSFVSPSLSIFVTGRASFSNRRINEPFPIHNAQSASHLMLHNLWSLESVFQ